MSKKPNAFLAALTKTTAEPDIAPPLAAPAPSKAKGGVRVNMKHVGAYFEKGDPILERVAILRARLDMTNSELIEHALNELWKRHEAGRAFGE